MMLCAVEQFNDIMVIAVWRSVSDTEVNVGIKEGRG